QIPAIRPAGRRYSTRSIRTRGRSYSFDNPSVSSTYVPKGSVKNATAKPSAGTFLYGTSNLIPSPSIFLQNDSRSFTSNPLWSSARPLVPTTGVSDTEKLRFTPGTSAASNLPRIPALALSALTYQALVSFIDPL